MSATKPFRKYPTKRSQKHSTKASKVPKAAKVSKASMAAVALTLTTAGAWTVLSPTPQAMASTYRMQTKSIRLNGKVLSAPSGFVYDNTTYMPLFYVQQLLDALHIENEWDGTTGIWYIHTPFSSQPTFTLKTTTGNMGVEINNKTFAGHIIKVVTTDPASNKPTTFIPIWYIKETLQAIGLDSDWTNGTVWNVKANYTDATKTSTILGAFTSQTDAESAIAQYPGGTVTDITGKVVFTEPSFVNVDLRYPAPPDVTAASIDKYLSDHNSIMAGLGWAFIDAQTLYGVNANYLVSHAMEETGSGGNVSSIALSKNNLFGYGAYDVNTGTVAGTFPSEAYAILFQAWEVRNNYLNPNSSHYVKPTLAGMAENYASDKNWANNVNNLMDQFAIDLGDTVARYQQYNDTNQPPAPTADTATPPTYGLNGAAGQVMADANYQSSVPVYSTAALGHQHMFVRVLQQGDSGDDVSTLLQALKAFNPTLVVDGIYGQNTAQAVQNYQISHGLSPTGEVDFALWNQVLNLSQPETTLSPGESIQVDQIVQGMAGGNVTEWFHVPSVNGWVNSADVTLTNVYKISVPSSSNASDVSVPVVSGGQTIATLHAGDYVVASSGGTVTSGGSLQVQFDDGLTGTPESGSIQVSGGSLSPVTR